MCNTKGLSFLCIALAMILTILACILPMGKLPLWNGEIPGHRNQYELITEAILDGRISFDYGDEDSLANLKNPYDPQERKDSKVYYHWDHAYYKGNYYMYFGIVPVFLSFLPYRVITGQPLTTYHATQFFVALAIAGIYALFYLLRRLFFKELPLSLYIIFSATFSIMSVWYSCAEPALYCTAITAAIALEVWSLYFFVRAVFSETAENRQILLAGIGALLGALVFGCRPPIALANIIVLPLLFVFLRKKQLTGKRLGKLVLAALPYVVVGVALMIYNYVRFENPFEFGQAYQLTVADQSNYRISLNLPTLIRIFNQTGSNFFQFGGITEAFPYLKTGGVFANFPILLLCAWVLYPSSWKKAKRLHLLPLFGGLLISVLVITAFDILWTPFLLERYRMDIYFLMGIGCFTAIGLGYSTLEAKHRRLCNALLISCAVITILSAFLLCVQTVGVYYPEKVNELAQLLRLA